ncbi:MAG: glycosyltransferase [Actinomycetota bacterium]|nr:glycosyltransferase [Actinomycetota bacterium]
MKLLIATATAFQPPYRGDSARLTAMIRYFRHKGWEVIVAHLHNPRQELFDYEAMRKMVSELIVCDTGRASVEAPGSPLCDDWCPDEFAKLVRDICETRGVDVLIAQFVFLSKCLTAMPDQLVKLLDADNIFSERRQIFSQAGIAYEWFSTTPDEEARALGRADLILAIQEREQKVLERLTPGTPVLLVPHAQPVIDCRRSDTKDLLFVANRSPANEHGLEGFVAHALPKIRKRHPDARLVLLGRIAEAFRGRAEGIAAIGPIEDANSYYREASIVLNVAMRGTGLKIKTVDAVCRGKCLVSTPAGIEGLENYKDAFVVAETWDAFADVISHLLSHSDLIREKENRALEFARNYFDPSVVFGRLEDAVLREVRIRSRPPLHFLDAAS